MADEKGTGPGTPEAGTPEAGKPAAGKPEAGKPEAGKPEAGKPEAGKPEAGKPEAGKPEAGKPAAGKPEAAADKKDAPAKPEAAAGKPEAAEKDAPTKPETPAKPVAPTPATKQPAPAKEPAEPRPARAPLSPALTSALTLGVAGLLVVVAAVWGWGALTKPFPGSEDLPVCVDTEIKAGDDLFRDQVVVSVFNGSSRNGLAGLTLDALSKRGFGRGATGNAPMRSKVTLVHYSQKNDPAALLVGKQFGKVKYVKSEGLGDGVLVVVGEQYRKLAEKAPESVTSKIDATYCAVPGSD